LSSATVAAMRQGDALFMKLFYNCDSLS